MHVLLQAIGLSAALEQERLGRAGVTGELAAAEAAARAAQAERDARASELAHARQALQHQTDKLAAAVNERDILANRVSLPSHPMAHLSPRFFRNIHT